MAFNGWLSPTSAWRLVQCPAALPGPAWSGQPLQQSGPSSDAGTLAHEAMRSWVNAGSWRSDPSGGLLRSAFDEAAALAGVDVAAVPRGVLTRARLGGLAGTLISALDGAGTDAVASEVDLADEPMLFHGRADIIVTGPHPAVLDLKTGKMSAGEVQEHIRFQLLMYAHLFRVVYGKLPERLEVLSLAQGRIDIPFGARDVADAVAAVARARDEAGGEPAPASVLCRGCPRRMACDSHWALEEDDRPDTVQGEVTEVTVAATGVLGVRLRAEPETWVTQLQPHQVPPGLQPGYSVRMVGISPSKPSSVHRRATRAADVVITG